MRINVKAALQREADRKAAIRPAAAFIAEKKPIIHVAVSPGAPVAKDILLRDAWLEIGALKRQRGKLSSASAYLVDEIETKLRSKNPVLADEFLSAKLPSIELKEHYAKIHSCTTQVVALFDRIRDIEQYGSLKANVPRENIETETADIKAMHHEVRRLDDLIYKTKKKLPLGEAKKSTKLTEWKEKIALAEARRDDIKNKIKRLQYESREARVENRAENN